MGKSSVKSSVKALGAWFERRKRILPWRDNPTLYRVWVSEIMLQQTQVITVVPYFERFMARVPSVESLAQADEADVLAHWAGLGYYSRARNLHQAARQVVAGGFPKDREGWLEIPGVGQYTAGAILSIALDLPEAILDGNVERVLSRVRCVGRARGDAAYKARLWRLARAVVREGKGARVRPSVTNQALMELGATICTPKKPRCGECPVATVCRARATGKMEAYPPKKKPKEWIQVKERVHCIVNSRGEVLLRQRAAGEWRAGLWDLYDREPRKSIGIRGKIEHLGSLETRHVVTRHKITRVTDVWRLRSSGKWSAAEGDAGGDLRWIRLGVANVTGKIAIGSAAAKTWTEALARFPGLATSFDGR